MQNFSFEAAERENLRQAGGARRQDLIPERVTSRHNNKAEVA
ncbi:MULTISPECIES: hypothetical protein [Mesorhizobium]|jgi:hypothetical protein|uniref:Uncharacterized protein n=1 Tax=Mesorhizobium delmotii TaxID=1631247 RepID=A0A2P9AHR6_9HYPH|nr:MULTISPECIES: hypothetical protein [Mesorhizobium]SJM30665.1 hypothetical protein BQ8482_170020 [Mesorhizobium delmotii]